MPESKGYKIPFDPSPMGLRCVKLYIPDDVFYLYALMGAYQYFTTWTAWEKDGTTRAAQAAAAWKIAYQQTVEEGTDCDMTDITPIVTALESLTAVILDCCLDIGRKFDSLEESQYSIRDSIDSVVLNTVNETYLNCLDCDDLPPYIDPQDDETPNPLDPPNNIPPEEWEDYLCRATNYLWDTQVDSLLLDLVQIINTTASGAVLGALLVLLAASGVGLPIVIGVSLIELGLLLINQGQINQVDGELPIIRDLIVCSIYTSSTTVEALTYINEIINDTPGVSEQTAGWVSNTIGNHYAINLIYSGQVEVPEEYVSPLNCEAACIDPNPNEPWYLNDVIGGYGPGSTIPVLSVSILQLQSEFTIEPSDPLHTRAVFSHDYPFIDVTAVTFFGDWDTDYSGQGELIKFGGDNNTIPLENQLAGWVRIKIAGTPNPPAPPGQPSYDYEFEVPSYEFLEGNLWVDYVGAAAPTIEGSVLIGAFTLHSL